MADAFTTNLSLTRIEVGASENTWGQKLNDNADLIDAAVFARAFKTTTVATSTGLTGGGDLSANRTLALTGQALALHNLTGTGFMTRTGVGTFAVRTITAGTGVAVTNGDGIADNPTLALTGQALALHNLASNGIVVRNGVGTFTNRSLSAGSGISISNSDGVSGNPTISISGSIDAATCSGITITAGNGMTGGGSLSTSRTITLGTPTSVTDSSTNSVTASGHTHALSSASVMSLVSDAAVGTVGTYALLYHTGGGALSPGVTYSGSAINYVGFNATGTGTTPTITNGGTATSPSGTWRVMGKTGSGGISSTLFMRVS